jgi:2-polyprenyl-3-methyl-5-hydroxy-6-metoxy-1,4-benzoquinol methylase
MALELSAKVTAVDFAEDMIEALRFEGVDYTCMEWNQFFDQTIDQFDTIMTDAGLTCLEFPKQWQRLADNVVTHLSPNGIFAIRAFINTERPPEAHYDNPNLSRFISGMGRVDQNWMMQIETHGDYADYDVRYAFPTDKVVLQTFKQLALYDKFIPDYEEGERFVSYAWKNTT